MIDLRFKSRHAKRLFSGVFATFVAASAMAFISDAGRGHQDEAPNGGVLGAHSDQNGSVAPL